MSDVLPNIRQPNLKSRVYELLLDMIVNGKYRENDMLPPERILCEELGVSRTVVREAVKSLESRGVLKVIHGKGIKVIPPTGSDISEAFMLYLRRKSRDVTMKDLMEIRYVIETEIAKVAARRAGEDDIIILEKIIENMERAVGDSGAFVLIDLEFHLHLAYMTRNILFVTILEALVNPLMVSFKETVGTLDNERSTEEHAALFQSIKGKRDGEAGELMARHLEHVERVLREHGKL